MSDVHWMNSRYAGKCSECECDISEGDEILYVPHEGRRAEVFCRPCGEDVQPEPDDPEVEV